MYTMPVRTHAGPPYGILSEHLSSNSALLWEKRPQMAYADDNMQRQLTPITPTGGSVMNCSNEACAWVSPHILRRLQATLAQGRSPWEAPVQ